MPTIAMITNVYQNGTKYILYTATVSKNYGHFDQTNNHD